LNNQKMVKQWFTYAARDLKMSMHSLEFSSEYKISGFHSQQFVRDLLLIDRG